MKHRFPIDLPFGVVSIELRHLRAFVAVAEELNFTRAARRLFLAQQALSAQVRQLEQLLGTPLFTRTTRQVHLTAAGQALLARAPALLAELEASLDAARRAAAGTEGALILGLLATAPLDLTPRLLRAFSEERPSVAVSVRNVAFDDPSGGVRDGTTDVALVWLPFDLTGLACESLYADPRHAVLPAGHPLAERSELEIDDILELPYGWIDDMDPVARDFWVLSEHRDGRPPRIGDRISGFDDLFLSVRAGRSIAVCPRSAITSLPPDLVTRPIRHLEPAHVATCHRADTTDPIVTAFVETARRVGRELEQQG